MTGFIKKISGFLSGQGGNLINSITESIDRFVTTKEEREKLKQALLKVENNAQQNRFNFIYEMEQLSQKRELEIEQTIRKELDAKRSVLLAELNQGDSYTKRARPTVIYAGLVFILLEMLGLRLVILDSMEANSALIASSNHVFDTFLYTWSGIVSVYAIGRTAEKRGSRNKLNKEKEAMGEVGFHQSSDSQAIVSVVKDKIKNSIKWQ